MAPQARELGGTPTRRYHLLELAGRGAYGDVYLAELDSGGTFRRKVALKLLNENASRLNSARQRIQAEARILGRLAHRNVVAALDFVRLDNRWAIVMDYVPGADLEHIVAALELRGERFPGPAAFEVGAAVADALHAAYHATNDDGVALGIIHRDIKPSNVRLTPDGEVKVLDFGVARGAEEPEARGTGVIGTERYMAPERLIGSADLPAGDVYSTAATVVELVLGRPLGRTPVLPENHREFVNEALYAVHNRLEGPAPLVKNAVDLLRSSLAARDGERPTARELADGCEAAARSLSGEPLRLFCRRFVPGIDEVLARVHVPVDGVLSEIPAPVELANVSGATLVPGDPNAQDPVPPPPPSPSRAARIAASLVVTAAVSALCGGVGVYGLTLLLPHPTRPVAVATPAPLPPPPVTPITPLPAPEPAPEVAVVEVPARAPANPKTRVVEAPSGPAPTVQSAKLVMAGKISNELQVRCGDYVNDGNTSVALTQFPAGSCHVTAWFDDRTVKLETDVTIDGRMEVECSRSGGQLLCSKQ